MGKVEVRNQETFVACRKLCNKMGMMMEGLEVAPGIRDVISEGGYDATGGGERWWVRQTKDR